MIRWLASYPKSGNTWVRLFINSYLSGLPININTPYQYIVSDVSLPLFQSVCCKPANTLSHIEQFYYRPAMLLNALHLSGTNELTLKTHHAKAVVDSIPIIPAEISDHSIYLIRDPRDVAISYARHTGVSINESIKQMNNMDQAGDHENGLIHLMLTWSKHVESWTTKNKNVKITVFKYEDLCKDKFIEILKIFKFKVKEERLDFALEQSSFKNLKKLEEEYGFREARKSQFFKHGCSVWKKILSQKQVDLINSQHKEVMKEYGYC